MKRTMSKTKHYLYADELGSKYISEGFLIIYDMPSMCSGNYEAVIKVDEQGRHYIWKDENHFSSCRDYEIVIPQNIDNETTTLPDPTPSVLLPKNVIYANMNNYVLVKLNLFGYMVWLKYNNQYYEYFPHLEPETIETLKSREDDDGYVKFHMWELMHIFGQHTAMGLESPFESMNIKIITDI
jgi:hypothetical protein